eukprot:gene25398-biopygen20981
MSPPPLPLKFQLPPKLREAADKVAAVIVDDNDIDFADFDACDDDDGETHKAAKAIEAAASMKMMGGRAPWRAPPSHHFSSTHRPPGRAPPSHRICGAHTKGAPPHRWAGARSAPGFCFGILPPKGQKMPKWVREARLGRKIRRTPPSAVWLSRCVARGRAPPSHHVAGRGLPARPPNPSFFGAPPHHLHAWAAANV